MRIQSEKRWIGAGLGVAFVLASAPMFGVRAQNAPVQTAPKTADGATSDAAWVNLFNGRDLEGWVQRGGKAIYAVKDGAIVGSTVPKTGNTFLCTPREYSDFVLELEFKVDPALNSGIQFRTNQYDEDKVTEREGKTFKVPAKRVHGYQFEIDPSKRAWTGGIYEEGRRGWLQDLKDKPEAQKAFKQNEWNLARIEARGAHIRTWLNGVPVTDLQDDLTPSGFIALQVHGVGDKAEPLEVMWRNIRVQDLAPVASPTK